MALPSIILPEYRIKLLTSDKEITIRPFTVKEEKILLMAAESNNKEIVYAIRQIIQNCAKGDFNIDELDFFELIYIFLHIKKVSSGEEITCKITEGKDEYIAKCNLNEDIVVDGLENLKKFGEPIQITGNDVYVSVRPMKFKDYIKLVTMFDINDPEKLDKVNFMYTSLLLTFDRIFTKESSFDPRDYTMEELSQFYESFPQGDKNKIQEKYNNLPRISLRFHYRDKNGVNKTKNIEKADFNFFG